MKKEWSTGQKTAVILGSICAGLLLLTVFCIDVFRLARYLFYVDADGYPTARYRQEEPGTYPESDSNDFQGGGYGDFDDGSMWSFPWRIPSCTVWTAPLIWKA
ncbi:MAG: hypothetical protein HFI99_08160 [Lachnospiraceae bacterium]|nr:hypothetical protein [Lachnospiraceae bacterium]